MARSLSANGVDNARPLFIKSPWGIGDSLYARPFIAAQAAEREIFLETPWPEFYTDLPVWLVRGHKQLRTQLRNLARQQNTQWHQPPGNAETVALGYGALELPTSNVAAIMERKLPRTHIVSTPAWDLPDMGPCPFDTLGAPMAIIRPVMRRTEWDNEARNPLPEYVCEIAADLKQRGYAVIVLCDEKHGAEWIDGPVPPHNLALTHGELSIRQLMASVRDAAIVVGGVGWIVPAAVALQTPTFVVLGGNGGMNAPERLLDPRMNTERIGFAMPERFCRCLDMKHRCARRIPDLLQQWNRWRRRMRLPDPHSSSASAANG
jgi:hypothetical protein